MSGQGAKPPAKRSDIDQFLAKVKSTPPAPRHGKGRLLFAIDATMSRQPLWDQASQLQAEMLLAAGHDTGLLVQFAYYRGLLEFYHSSWVDQPERLTNEMTRVYCQAGQTQLGRTLQHMQNETRQHKVNAAVFVGDALEESAEDLYKLAGQLGLLGMPLFIFQEGYDPRVEAVYRKLAQLTGGAYCRFDAGSVAQLKELLKAVAEYAAGGYMALEDYARRHQNTRALELIRQLPSPKR
ncbi:hypothetical protein BTA51_20815 [Hahella sp. CCB-MM4]|uniref:hypothetical protein n=1 Tax=Hahella sp. (strain CCB-MM4) TaxID=1926491 RepID=UPI000B9AB588|nr:hypothetical protein [Hahella sp. CCB-MM4]OZG71381.1 hypothetical protein BTA51_20815 [Hahella sp. CCB-MM4]